MCASALGSVRQLRPSRKQEEALTDGGPGPAGLLLQQQLLLACGAGVKARLSICATPCSLAAAITTFQARARARALLYLLSFHSSFRFLTASPSLTGRRWR